MKGIETKKSSKIGIGGSIAVASVILGASTSCLFAGFTGANANIYNGGNAKPVAAGASASKAVDSAVKGVGGAVSTATGALNGVGNAVNSATGALSGVNNAVNGAISNVAGGLSGALGGVTGAVSTSGLGGILGSVNDIISNITGITSGLDGLFGDSTLGSISDMMGQVGALSKCFNGAVTLPSPSSAMGGLCGSLGGSGGLGGIGDILGGSGGELTKCLGVDFGGIGNITSSLGSICGTGGGTGGGGTGGTGGWGGGTGGTGGWGTGSGSRPTPQGKYEPLTGAVSASAEIEALPLPKSTGIKTKKIDDIKFPSGLSGKDIYRDGGGAIAKKAVSDETSTEARAWFGLNNDSLVLQDFALRAKGVADESALHLPATPADAKEFEDKSVGVRVSGEVMYYSIQKKIVSSVIKEYQSIPEQNTVSDYIIKEREKFDNWVKSKKEIQEQYKSIALSMGGELNAYAIKSSRRTDFVFDTSENRARFLDKSLRSAYVLASLAQMERNAEAKAKIITKVMRKTELLDLTIERAYLSSSVFPTGAAEKEIDNLLKAIDTAIR